MDSDNNVLFNRSPVSRVDRENSSKMCSAYVPPAKRNGTEGSLTPRKSESTSSRTSSDRSAARNLSTTTVDPEVTVDPEGPVENCCPDKEEEEKDNVKPDVAQSADSEVRSSSRASHSMSNGNNNRERSSPPRVKHFPKKSESRKYDPIERDIGPDGYPKEKVRVNLEKLLRGEMIDQEMENKNQRKSRNNSDNALPVQERKLGKNEPRVAPSSSISSKPKKPEQESSQHEIKQKRELDPSYACLDVLKFHSVKIPYIDSHCHTDFLFRNLKGNRHIDGIKHWMLKFPRAFPQNFTGIIANFIEPTLFVKTKGNDNCHVDWIIREIESSGVYNGTTFGCHPHHSEKWLNTNLWETLEKILNEKEMFKVKAVGECGIDLYKCDASIDAQMESFRRQVALAFKYDVSLVVHCRRGRNDLAETLCLQVLEEEMEKNHRRLQIHRHCYTEDWENAQRWIKTCPGVYFGYTPGIYNFSARQLEAVRRIPLNRILLETDAPFFKPKPLEDLSPLKMSMPGFALSVAFKIAEIKNISVDEVVRATYENTKKMYDLEV